MWVAYWTVAATNSPPDPKVPINQTQPWRVRIRTGLRMHAAGVGSDPERAATGHSKFRRNKSVPQWRDENPTHYPQSLILSFMSPRPTILLL